MAASDKVTEGQLDTVVAQTQAAFGATRVMRGLLANLNTTFKGSLVGAINEVFAMLTSANIKTLYEGNANTNAFTDGEKTKLAGLDDNHFKGTFANLAAIPTAGAVAGDYAFIAVTGGDDRIALWDVDGAAWVDSGASSSAETPASIKTKYESNPDTNAFTDADQTKLENIVASTKDYTGAITA